MTFRRVIIDHVDLLVSDLPASLRFFQAALEPLGYRVLMENERSASFGVDGTDDFGINASAEPTTRAHIAFVAQSREAVERFFELSVSAGGEPKSAPALRPKYHAEYFSAYVLDPDGNNIEAVYHGSKSFS